MPSQYLHLLRGDDQHGITRYLKDIVSRLGADFDPAMNRTRLDGKTAPLEELKTAVTTLPFFGSYRLVIYDLAPGKLDKAGQSRFTSLLEGTPPTTHLVLLAEDHKKWRKDGGAWVQIWDTFTPAHWLVKWFTAHETAEVIDLPMPDAKQMDAWIAAEAQRQGGRIEPAAANELSRHTCSDTSIASQEIAKLLMYVNYERAVTREDVLALVSEEGSADVFIMLDRLMEGRMREAQAMMRSLLDDTQPEIVLGAVIHRFRQLIQVCEGMEAGEDQQVLARKTGVFQNRIADYIQAARRLGMNRLEQIYRRLLEMDLQAKTSKGDLATNLEMLVLEVGN